MNPTSRNSSAVRLSANAPICRCNRSQAQFPPHFQTRSESRRSGSQFLFYSFGVSMLLLHMRAPNLAVLPLPLPPSGTCFIQANHNGAFSTKLENITHLTEGKKKTEGLKSISVTRSCTPLNQSSWYHREFSVLGPDSTLHSTHPLKLVYLTFWRY